MSLLSGFAEAALIFLVVRTAASLAGNNDAFQLSIGPINDDLSTSASLAIAGGAVVVVLVLSAVAAVLTAQLTGASLNRARRRTMRSFLDAGWEIQSRESAGRQRVAT